jgi:hypothetical protein
VNVERQLPANLNGVDESRESGRAEMLRAVCVALRKLSLQVEDPRTLELLYKTITARGFLL